ncbi:hypothetical protein EDC96DRAFT_492640 [Choanephora cucurbitarum]|nr:hypothetical protein EDC96DRAFT_492640 [Choanephora cucurbitarum]
MSYPFELKTQYPFHEQPLLSQQSKTTLWMGELEPHWDEQYIRQIWFSLNQNVVVKVIRDKATGMSAGYAFVDFGTAANARLVMATFNGVPMPNSHRSFKLNWASGGGLIDRKEDRQPEYSIFVGDLSPEVNETELLAIFQAHYHSCKSAKIMTDPKTGMTRGYGFVRFSELIDQQRSLVEMQGQFIGSRPIRVSVATPKNNHHLSPLKTEPSSLTMPESDHLNTTVFVGGLSAPIGEEELRHYFQHFGPIVYVKIPPGKGCGFVQYVTRQSAEMAIQHMNGFQIGHSRIRLSWGRSQNEKKHQTPSSSSPLSHSPLSHSSPLLPPNGLAPSLVPLSPTLQYAQQRTLSLSSLFANQAPKRMINPTYDDILMNDNTNYHVSDEDFFQSVTKLLEDEPSPPMSTQEHQYYQQQHHLYQQRQQKQQQTTSLDWKLNQIYAQ